MTHLRQMMLDELERRNYSANTIRRYIDVMERYARYFDTPPDRLGPEHIRQYQAHLFRDRKLHANTVAQRVSAVRFFYVKTLGQSWILDRAPYPKRPRQLPNILSREEVARLIEAAQLPFYRTIVMTLYGTGVRRSELTQLRLEDIDSERMVVHIRGGKGRKDRDVMLSEQLLHALREHIRRLRRRPLGLEAAGAGDPLRLVRRPERQYGGGGGARRPRQPVRQAADHDREEVRGTDLIDIFVYHTDADEAAELANSIADMYRVRREEHDA